MVTDAGYVGGVRVVPACETLSMVNGIFGDQADKLSGLVIGGSVQILLWKVV